MVLDYRKCKCFFYYNKIYLGSVPKNASVNLCKMPILLEKCAFGIPVGTVLCYTTLDFVYARKINVNEGKDMADLKKVMLEEIRKSSFIQTSSISETEEYIDTGLAKTDENIQMAALNYLDEKGYRRRVDNLEYAKKMILECSEGYDTVIIKRKSIVEQDLFEKAGVNELRDALNVCMLNTMSAMNAKLERMANISYEYKVETIDAFYTEAERPRGHLSGDFETFEELLNRYSQAGWQLDRVQPAPKTGNMPARNLLIFKKEKMV